MQTIINLIHSLSPLAIFFLGLSIRIIVDMRRFNRRGLGGLQHFNNYFVGLFTILIEWLFKWLGSGFMLYGLWGWIFR